MPPKRTKKVRLGINAKYVMLLLSFYHLTLYVLSQFEFIFSLENDVMAALKNCFFVTFYSLVLHEILSDSDNNNNNNNNYYYYFYNLIGVYRIYACCGL